MASPGYPMQRRSMPQQRQWNPAMRGRPMRRPGMPAPMDGPIQPPGPAQLDYSDQPIPQGDPYMPPPGPAQVEPDPIAVDPYIPPQMQNRSRLGSGQPYMQGGQPTPPSSGMQPLQGNWNPRPDLQQPTPQYQSGMASQMQPMWRPPQPQRPPDNPPGGGWAKPQSNAGFSASNLMPGSSSSGYGFDDYKAPSPQPSSTPSQASQSWDQPRRPQGASTSSNVRGFARGGIPAYQPGSYPGGNPGDQRDVFDQFQRIGQNNFQQGQGIDQEYGNLANYYRANMGDASERADSLYDPIWNGGGGYRQDQMENVLQKGGLEDIQSQLGDNQLYDWEKNQIRGDPYKAFNLFHGQAPELTSLAAKTGNQARGFANEGRNRSDSALGQMRSDYESAIDPRKLSLSEGYKPGIDSALQRGRSGVTSAQTDPGLDTTAEYERQAGMTDAEVSDMASRAAQDVGARYGADRDAIWQQAVASGQGSPAQMASVMNRLNRSSAADRGDAITRARLEARAAQRDAAGNVQATKLGAGQYRAGLRSANELALQNSDIAANTTAEQMRLAAEQGISGAKLGATANMGNAALNSNNAMTQAEIDAALRSGQMELGTGMYNADKATGLVGQAEAADQARSQGLATNRQATNVGNQGVSLGINQSLANRYTGAYAPWLANQAEGRQAATDTRNFYAGQGNTADQQRTANRGLTQQGQQNASQGYAGWGSSAGGQGFGDVLGDTFGKFLGNPAEIIKAVNAAKSGGKARGGMIGQNQLIEVGEGDRPELILPLTPKTPEDRRNQWERMGAQLGKQMGIPQGNAYRMNLERQDMESNPEEIEGYATGGIPNMALGNEYDWRSMLPDNVRGFLPEEPEQDDQSDPWSNEYGYEGYRRGGIPNAKSLLNKSRYRMNMGLRNEAGSLAYA